MKTLPKTIRKVAHAQTCWHPMPWMLFILFAVIRLGAIGCPQAAGQSIRSIDFKNFSYPWIHPDGWPNHLQWMSLRLKEHVRLVNGKRDERDESEWSANNGAFAGLTLEGISYVRLSDSSGEEAIVVLRYDTGGTRYHYWVYVYGLSGGTAKLMGFFHSGDRANNGLYRVFEKDHLLTVQLFDPAFQEGDCCSSGYVSYRYRWNGGGFEVMGTPTKGKTDSSSRRVVSVFGLPVDQ